MKAAGYHVPAGIHKSKTVLLTLAEATPTCANQLHHGAKGLGRGASCLEVLNTHPCKVSFRYDHSIELKQLLDVDSQHALLAVLCSARHSQARQDAIPVVSWRA
mgnify:CR=1 FL=1